MTVHRPHGLVLIGGNGVTGASRDKFWEQLSAQGYKYLDRVVVFGRKDQCPEKCPVTAE